MAGVVICQSKCPDRSSFARLLPTGRKNEPLADDVCCLDNDNERPRLRLSDDQVWQEIIKYAGVGNSSDFQKLEKSKQRETLRTLLETGASVRQLQRLTGLGRGIIQRV